MPENERGATGDGTPTKWQASNDSSPFTKLPPPLQPIRAGADAPVPALCRELLAAGLDPDAAVELALRVRSPLLAQAAP
jgi:hypothetical protein